ncbi:hypothetical protein ACFMQL_00900 [Nonomuraea fastidiosa]|jgi:hypothetical protein|uniref:hypothetical protein n=1 Tax=Nonomuraea TaxID=83681 RepID=UPI00324805C1
MRFALRRAAVAVAAAGGFMLATAPASHAVIDPAVVLDCLTAATDVGGLLDPAALTTELPLTGCLAP